MLVSATNFCVTNLAGTTNSAQNETQVFIVRRSSSSELPVGEDINQFRASSSNQSMLNQEFLKCMGGTLVLVHKKKIGTLNAKHNSSGLCNVLSL